MAKIMVDLDSTIIDTCKSIINLHNKISGRNIEYRDNYTWSFEPIIKTKEELGELFKLFDHKDFYDKSTSVVFKNSIKVINELSMQNDVVICSKHEMARRPITRKWISETFPTVDIVFTNSFDKSEVGHVDIAIDDKPEALASIDADYKILFGVYDWNKDSNIMRATDWSELYKIIRNIKDTIESNKLIEINMKDKDGIKRWEF